MARLVICRKLGRELPGLDEVPFAGELGQRIYDSISAEAYALWREHAKTLIATYRLNMAEQGGRNFLREQMEEFFFGDQAQMPDWFAGQAPGSKGGKGGAPTKGSTAAGRK